MEMIYLDLTVQVIDAVLRYNSDVLLTLSSLLALAFLALSFTASAAPALLLDQVSLEVPHELFP